MTLLSIVMPTIEGREDEFVRTIQAYERLTPFTIEWIVEVDHPTCAQAWNAGARKAKGEILHLGNDDLEPETAGWLPAAILMLDQGCVPVGWVREDTAAGTFGRDFCRVPLCLRDWFKPLPEIHYWSDNAFTDIMQAQLHPPFPAEGFDFYHRRSMVGRDESPPRLNRDSTAYHAWRAEHLH